MILSGEEGKELISYWSESCLELGVIVDESVCADLIQRYQEPHRYYHSLQHLKECFSYFEKVKSYADQTAELWLAIWFHDAIYNPFQSNNELQSARLAEDCLNNQKVPAEIVARVMALIMATCHTTVPEENDSQLMVDIDLAILGAEPDRFKEYEQQIRAEYAWVPEVTYDRERRKVLQAFYQRPCLYSTPWFRDHLEISARKNLGRVMNDE